MLGVAFVAFLAVGPARPLATSTTGPVFGVNDDNLRHDWSHARTEQLPAGNQVGVWINLSAPDRDDWQVPDDRDVLAQVLGDWSDWARDPAKYARAVRDLVVAHPNIREVQVWNEPDLCSFPCMRRDAAADVQAPGFRGRAAMHYLDFLAATYDLVHPLGVKVLGFGLSSNIDDRWTPERVAHQIRRWYRVHGGRVPVARGVEGGEQISVRWMEGRYRRPIMDGFAYHPYCKWQPRYTHRVYRALKRLRLPGGTPQIWWTESGTTQTTSPRVPDCAKGSESDQAARLRSLLRQARKNPHIAGMFNFLLNDTVGDTAFRTGFYRPDGTAKPALAVWIRETAQS